MKLSDEMAAPILLTGEGKLLASVALCLIASGHHVNVYPVDPESFNRCYQQHLLGRQEQGFTGRADGDLRVLGNLSFDESIQFAIVLSAENLSTKLAQLQKIESAVSATCTIAINSETYSLAELGAKLKSPDRLIGLNWTEPAHTTLFLEIIAGVDSKPAAEKVLKLSKNWGKDAYLVEDTGVRSLLLSAMAREASFLVDNGYASVEDIDRACRNDAGYYLPFSGNCRYMDLMGTYAYGMVMKDLNPELSKDKDLPEFFKKIQQEGALGMDNENGFYKYTAEDVEEWKETMEKFSYEIQKIIEKYPFNYDKETYLD